MVVTPGGALIVVPARGADRWYREASWRHSGRRYKRRLGEAWIRPRASSIEVKGWSAKYEKRPGNPPGGELTPQQATVAMRDLIVVHAAAAPLANQLRTFRQAANAWLDEPHARAHSWRPETYAFNRGLLAEPGEDVRRGRILGAFGDRRVDRIDVEDDDSISGYTRRACPRGGRARWLRRAKTSSLGTGRRVRARTPAGPPLRPAIASERHDLIAGGEQPRDLRRAHPPPVHFG